MNGHTKWIVPLVVVLAFIIGNFVKPVLAINDQVIKNTSEIQHLNEAIMQLNRSLIEHNVKLDRLLIASGVKP